MMLVEEKTASEKIPRANESLTLRMALVFRKGSISNRGERLKYSFSLPKFALLVKYKVPFRVLLRRPYPLVASLWVRSYTDWY